MEPQVFDLLRFLIENRDRAVSREEIFHNVWRARIVSDSVLGTQINAVRRAIGDDGARQRLIRTVRGIGFRFVGTVSAVAPPPRPTFVVPTNRLSATLERTPALAVLPFTRIGDDGRGRSVAEALVEEVEAALYGIDWLPVVSRRSASEGDDSAGVREAARRSRARYLLRGSLRLERDDARVIVRLTDAATGIQLWVDGFDFPVSGAFAAQTEIAAKVAYAVGDQIFAAESIRVRRKSPEGLAAWDAVVCALDLISTRNKEKADVAQKMLRKAIHIDAQSSIAYGLLSFIATLGVHQAWHSRKTARSWAIGAAEQAIALDNENSWAHLAAGYARLYVANQPSEAIEVLKHALSLNANLAMAHYLIALASTYIKKPHEAFEHAELAERLRTRSLLARGNAGAHDNVRATACFVTGRYEDGMAFARKAIAQSPRQTSAYRQVVTNGAYAGELDQAREALKIAQRLGPELQRFISQSETLYSDRSDYRKYVEAFRLAGYR